MIFIATAMYIEAEAFIKKLELKKDTTITKFQVFKNNDITLIITGTGKIKASIALTYLFSKNEPTEKDIFINIGICGSRKVSYKIGDTFLCNKIIDNDTKRTYFSDIIFKHPFYEESLECSSLPCSSLENFTTKDFSDNNNNNFPKRDSIRNSFEGNLIDMESSGLYESAITFLHPHEIFFIKIISDFLDIDKKNVTLENIKEIISNSSDSIINWIINIKNNYTYDREFFTPKEIELIDTISKNLKFSCSMENEFKQLIKYYELTNHGDYSEIIKNTLPLKCNSKKEGKLYLEELRKTFI